MPDGKENRIVGLLGKGGCIIIAVLTILMIVSIGVAIQEAQKPMTIKLVNTNNDILPFELYIDGKYLLNDTIDPKGEWEYDYKNGFWGPGKTLITVKLPNTLFEKEGYGSTTALFVLE